MRTKNSTKSFIYATILTTVIALLGIIKIKVFLQYLGDDNVGIYQLFYQLFLYISLIDSGITVAVAYFLYKPINDKNYKRINQILSGAKDYFNKIGVGVIGIGILLSFFIMYFIKSTELSVIYIRVCFILFIIASSMSYFISARTILYEAEQRVYKSSNINHIMTIVKTILEIILVMLGYNLIVLLTMFLILTIIRNVVLVVISKKDHPNLNLKESKEKPFKKEAKNLIVQKANVLIFDNTDIIIISKFLGLLWVVIYTAHYQITNTLNIIVGKITSATLASVGNLLVDKKEKACEVFYEMNSLLFFIANVICIPLLFMITPFISIWFGNKYTTSFIVVTLFIIILYINIIKVPLDVFMNAAGEFKNIKKVSIYQSIINISLSLILINIIGIAGVLLATILAFLIGHFIFYPPVIHKRIFDKSYNIYYLKLFKYIMITIISYVLLSKIIIYLENANLFIWFINGCIIFSINFLISLCLFKLFRELLFSDRLKIIYKIFIKNKEM